MNYVYLLATEGERHEDCNPRGAYTDLEKLIYGVLEKPMTVFLPPDITISRRERILMNSRYYRVILLPLDDKMEAPNRDFEFTFAVNFFTRKIHIEKFFRRKNSHGKIFYRYLKKLNLFDEMLEAYN